MFHTQLQKQRHWVKRGLNRGEANHDIHFLRLYLYNEVRKRTTLMTINKSKHFTFFELCTRPSRDLSQKRKQQIEPQMARYCTGCLPLDKHTSVLICGNSETEKQKLPINAGVLSRCKIRFVLDSTKVAFFSNREDYVPPS